MKKDQALTKTALAALPLLLLLLLQQQQVLGQRPAAASVSATPSEPSFLQQRQDHFDGSNANTWMQAYYVNDTFWEPGSDAPVFLCVGGEGPPLDRSVVVSSVHCNVAVEWLKEKKALMFALEHRYYGCHNMSACPLPAWTDNVTADFRFLSSRQALADVAAFHAFATAEYGLDPQRNKWVSWGGSYPGMLAGWTRLRFPHLIHAAVASSAPVRAKLNMQVYFDIVADSYGASEVGGSAACTAAIATGHAKIGGLMQNPDGRKKLAELFDKVGSAQELESRAGQQSFAGYGVANFPAQSNDPACTESMCNIARICAAMTNVSAGDEVSRLAVVANAQAAATKDPYLALFPRLRGTRESDRSDLFWTWQTCAEFGFYQTCDVGTKCPWVQGLVTLDDYTSQCEQVFGISNNTVAENIAFSNTYYGGDHPSGSRVLWPNGDIDPWHGLSVLLPLPGQPVLMVDGASHHAWTHPSLPTDQASVVKARAVIRQQVETWLKEE